MLEIGLGFEARVDRLYGYVQDSLFLFLNSPQ